MENHNAHIEGIKWVNFKIDKIEKKIQPEKRD